MSDFTRFIAAGVELTFAGAVGTDGLLIGGLSASLPASGAAGAGMARLSGIKVVPLTTPEPEVVAATGDDTTQGTFIFDSANPSQFSIQKSVFDFAADAFFQGTLTRDFGGITTGIMRPSQPVYPDVCWIFNRKTKKKRTTPDGIKAYSGYIVPLSNVFPRQGDQMTERTVADDFLTVAMQPVNQYNWGLTLTEALNGTEVGYAVPFNSDNPIHMKRWVGDNATVTFTLDYTPVSVAKTYVIVTPSGGVPFVATVNSVSVANKTFTLSAAPATNAAVVALYEFAP